MSAPSRLVAVAAGLTLLLFAGARAWEYGRFGLTDRAMAARIEREVRQTVAARAGDVETLARHVAAEAPLIVAATSSRDQLSALFDRLVVLSAPVDSHGVAVTIYVPTPDGYRILAWSDGPGESNLAPERLAGPAALFVAPGHAGMRLVFVEPVLTGTRRVAVAVAETVLATVTREPAVPERQLPTSFGPVSVVEQYASAREARPPQNGFVIASDTGAPLLEVRLDPAELAARRLTFRHRFEAVALLPLAAGLALLIGPVVGRRRRERRARGWAIWTGLAVVLLLASAGAFTILVALGRAPAALRGTVGAAALLGLVALIPGNLWWRARQRRCPRATPARFAFEQLAAGLVLAATLEVVARLLGRSITPTVLDTSRFVLFPFDAGGLLALGNVLMVELAAAWTAAAVLATIANRWRLTPRRPAALVALALWLLPVAGLRALPASLAGRAALALLPVVVAGAVFALRAAWIRRRFRHTTQSTRLLLAFAAVLVPLMALYPLSAATADRLTRHVIEDDYGPAIAHQPEELRAELARARDAIDALPSLPALVAQVPTVRTGYDSQAAFLVWSQTPLSRSRVISDVELYSEDRTLVSRFALNLPEYVYRTTQQNWQGHGCGWEVFGEVTPFGAEERLMLHAERGVCDASGRLLGGIVVHVASNDYQALPFISSPSPYSEVLGAAEGAPPRPRLPDLRVTVYGWSYQPVFTSTEELAWPVAPSTLDRLYSPGTPFWTSLPAGGDVYHVYFLQNRAGIYALGYPQPTLMDHAARLAEMAAIAGVIFVLLQVAAAAAAPLVRQSTPPLRVVLHEIRTSFYRKLFLFFVAAAVVPVLVSAIAFDSYMTNRLRADVEKESASTVTVARRVFEELAAAGDRGLQPQSPPTDDVMVWIRQVIDQDVNLFDGSELLATSQRDLFDSGLLPTRTPATVYRGIALERQPTLVAEDRIGTFVYQVAAAPVPARGPDAVLTVPLAPRQREIEREIDTLNRRLLVGVVLVVLFAAGLGASLASRVADPVARLTRATRQLAAGRLDLQLTAHTSDELGRLVDDFNGMSRTLLAQRDALARANQLKAWNEMARQVAHEIKNPLTPIQLAAEHLQHVHEDLGRPIGAVLDQCLRTILDQVRLLRRIASEFSNFAGEPTVRLEPIDPADLIESVIGPYRLGLVGRIRLAVDVPPDLPAVRGDRALLSRALANLVENAVQAMPGAGALSVRATLEDGRVVLRLTDTGVGMDAAALARAFEPYFSTKTGGSGLGLANARRHIELGGGTVAIASTPGAGTTATVSLPLAEAPPAASAGGSSPSR